MPTTSLRRATVAVALTGLFSLGLAACANSTDAESGPSSPAADSAAASPSPKQTPTSSASGSAEASGDLATFCATNTALNEMEITGDSSDPAALAAISDQFAAMLPKLDATVPPAEISDAWSTQVAALHALADGFAALAANPADAEAMAAMQQVMQDAANNTAIEAVDQYVADHCS